jgi:hypothetical protein
MKPSGQIEQRIAQVGAALAQALGERVVCIAVYGSAASEEFSPAHSDVNLLLVLSDVSFADLRLIGVTLAREAPSDLRFASPLVLTPSFLRDARDSFPIELDDIRERHRILAGTDLLADLRVATESLREQAEREARGKLLRLRALVIHRPPDDVLRQALASLAAVLGIIERALLHATLGKRPRGQALFEEIEKHAGIKLRALPRLEAIREDRESWPAGADLDDLLQSALREVEALVQFIDDQGR